MKYKGSSSDFLSHRNEFIYSTFRRIYMSLPVDTPVYEAYRLTAQVPSPRFWVSDTRAAIVISEMERADLARKRKLCRVPEMDLSNPKRAAMMRKVMAGSPILVRTTPDESEGPKGSEDVVSNMYPERREMYLELYRRYKELRQRHPTRTTVQLMADLIYDPAPKSYLSPHGVRKIVQAHRRNP